MKNPASTFVAMKTITILFSLLLAFVLKTNAQCNCSGSGFGMGLFDQGAGFLQKKQALLIQLTHESRNFAPHSSNGHSHEQSAIQPEEAEISKLNTANLALVFQPQYNPVRTVVISSSNVGRNFKK
jgi:hypothetical protein